MRTLAAAALAGDIADQLGACADPSRAEQERRYLKSDLQFLGAAVPDVRRTVRGPAAACRDRDEVLALAAALWARPVHELRLAAALLLDARAEVLRADDLPLLESLVRQARTWALVDVLVPGPVAAIDARTTATVVLDAWASDPDVWLRRSALLAHLKPLRAGAGDWDRFAGYADALLGDREFFVRKAMGWVLRETGRRRPALVDAWVAPRTGQISGVALREAVKPLPPSRREVLLAAYRRREPAAAAVQS